MQVNRNSKKFRLKDRPYEIVLEPSDDNGAPKWFYRYLKGKNPRDVNYVRMMDAYIKSTKILEVRSGDDALTTEQTGEVFGAFLRDPRVFLNKFAAAWHGQKLLGLYYYADRDAAGIKSGKERYLAFVQGRSPRYLLCLDFFYEDGVTHTDNEYLQLQYGFCIPGDEFSPLIARTFHSHERVVGLLYTPDAMINFTTNLRDPLKMDLFATDKDRFRVRHVEKQDENDIMAAAESAHNGPRLQLNLNKVKNALLHSKLQQLIDRIRLEYLQ